MKTTAPVVKKVATIMKKDDPVAKKAVPVTKKVAPTLKRDGLVYYNVKDTVPIKRKTTRELRKHRP